MNVVTCEDYDRLSAAAAALVVSAVERKKDLLLCAATGNSPKGLYDALVGKAKADRGFFAALRIVKLDEWGGIAADHPGSAERYLRERLLDPLGIPPERYLAFAPAPPNPDAECARIGEELERQGPIDVCVLGLGVNGHLGFNEPGPFLVPQCHVARLSEESRRHTMVRAMAGEAPEFGLTLGMREILASRRIILLVTGSGKEQAVAELLSGRVSTMLPASFLWLHGNVDCLIDRGSQSVRPG